MIRSLLPEEADRLLDTLDTPPSVSVRLSRTKPCRESLPFVLEDAVPWSGGLGFYLSERPSFTADPLWHAGGYYVQEASSMLLSSWGQEYASTGSAPSGKCTREQ